MFYMPTSISSYLPTWMQTQAPNTAAPVQNQPIVNSSIQVAEDATLTSKETTPGLFGPPPLCSPLLVIHVMDGVYTTASKLLEIAFEEVKYMGDRISNTWADIVNKVNKNVSWSQQADMWSTLQKIGGLILSTYNLAMGSAIYASGSPVLGSTLIAAGLLSTANIAITEMGGWSYLAEKLSQDNKKLQEQIAFWAPMTLYALSATTSITAAYDPTLLTQIPSLEWKNYLDNMESVLIAGKGAANAGLEWTQSSLLSLQTALFTDNFARDVLTSWIQKFMETLESGWEQARNIVSITTQMKV